MTDNEKRAHDLAVAMLISTMKPETIIAIGQATGQDEIHVDVYGIYKDYYDMFLDPLNRDFPNGKQ